MECHVYWLLKSFCFDIFADRKYGLFRVKKLIEIWYLLITEKFLFWIFWWRGIRFFFSQKVDGNMIFSWSFWAFNDIPEFRKYGFLCSVKSALLEEFNTEAIFQNICFSDYDAELFFLKMKWTSLPVSNNWWSMLL